MKLKNTVVALMMSAGVVGGASAFSLDDIHYWVGEGTNRCGVVVDWSNGGGGTLAWGYRWNGTCTNVAEVVARIAHEDPRLGLGVQGMTTDYVDLFFFGYDVNDNHPKWDMDNGDASDKEAYFLREDSVWYSAWWVFYGPMNGTAFPTTPQTSSWFAANSVTPQNNDWFVFSWGYPDYDESWNEAPAVLAEPTYAESPYGFEVVASMTSETKANYNKATNVLGHPTMYMSGAWGGPITPANPAWMAGELFTMKTDGDDEDAEIGDEDGPGFVTIGFDHDVMDDPANPFGLDFIVFGNAMCVLTSSDYIYESGDPRGQKCKGTGNVEETKVEVSQDGRTWYSSPEWGPSDAFAPTLGYLYEPDGADPLLFSGNRYWGRAAHATRPVNPSVDFSDTANRSVADVCNFYNGSAGGRGYDLAKAVDGEGNPLPMKNGRKWIRYVRVSGVYISDTGEGDSGFTEPEIDAVADVAPVSAYEKWVEANYTDWTTAWKAEVTGPAAVAANGRSNGANYLLGLAADETSEALEFRISEFIRGEMTHTLVVLSNKPMTDSCGLVVKGCDTLGDWNRSELPALESSDLVDGVYRNVFRVSADCGRFFKLSLEVE